MDIDKCNALKTDLESDPEQFVPIDRFFDGNDDVGSIGCNLFEHPGIDRFREILVGLTRREDVEAVYVQIAEIDPDDEAWPFSDTVLVVGTIDPETLQEIVAPLMPDEVGLAMGSLPPAITDRHTGHIVVLWWD